MKSFYKRLFWGHIFIVINFNVPIDILPNVFGWLLVASAFRFVNLPLRENVNAKITAYLLAILSLPLLFMNDYLETNFLDWMEWISVATSFLALLFYYWLFTVCLQLDKSFGEDKQTSRLKWSFLTVQIISIMYEAASFNFNVLNRTEWLVLMVIVNGIVYVWLFIYLVRMGNQKMFDIRV